MEQQVIDYCKDLVKSKDLEFVNATLARIGSGHNEVYHLGANYALVFKNAKGHLTSLQNSGICHGGLALQEYNYSEPRAARLQSIALVTLVMPFEGPHKDRHGWEEEQLYNWYNWIANESHACDAFITKDAKEMIEEGCIIDASAPMNIFNLACILTRVPSEVTSRPFGAQLLQAAIKAGVYPALSCSAAMAANVVQVYVKERPLRYLNGIRAQSSAHSHCPYPIYGRTDAEWKMFLTGGVRNQAVKAPYNTKESWGGVFDLTYSNQYGYENSDICNSINKRIEQSGILGEFVKSDWSSRYVSKEAPDVNAIFAIISEELLSFQEKMLADKVAKKAPEVKGEQLAAKAVRKPTPRKKYAEPS